METTVVKLSRKSDFGKKAYTKQAEVGKWFKFDVIQPGEQMVGFGKVVALLEDGKVEVEKYFELPSYRPYASRKWFDELPFAIE